MDVFEAWTLLQVANKQSVQVSNCHPGDQLFFVFCGHGAQVPVYESLAAWWT